MTCQSPNRATELIIFCWSIFSIQCLKLINWRSLLHIQQLVIRWHSEGLVPVERSCGSDSPAPQTAAGLTFSHGSASNNLPKHSMPLHHEAPSNTFKKPCSMGFYQKKTFAVRHNALPFKTFMAKTHP